MQNEITILINNDVLAEYSEYYFAIHPRARKHPIPHPYHESINKWMIMKRPEMNCLKQKWKVFIQWLINRLGYNDLHIEKCIVTQMIYFPTNRRHDNDNNVPKFILDGLVESGMVVDDDSEHITELRMKCSVDKDDPRTELTVTVLD